jgi:hypothetical protein
MGNKNPKFDLNHMNIENLRNIYIFQILFCCLEMSILSERNDKF